MLALERILESKVQKSVVHIVEVIKSEFKKYSHVL